MRELERLKKLLDHWSEHNLEHAETYREWAEKISKLGNRDAAETLERLSLETKKLQSLFEEVREKVR